MTSRGDQAGRFGCEIIEHFVLTLDALNALRWAAQNQPSSNITASLAERIAEIRLLFPDEWSELRGAYEENQERMGVTRLYAAFEGLLKRDGHWRATTPTANFHQKFSSLPLQKTFIGVRDYLNCWRGIWPTDAHHPHVGQIDVLNDLFTHERNPLMHDDQSLVPPLRRVQSQLDQAVQAFRALAPDFADDATA